MTFAYPLSDDDRQEFRRLLRETIELRKQALDVYRRSLQPESLGAINQYQINAANQILNHSRLDENLLEVVLRLDAFEQAISDGDANELTVRSQPPQQPG